MSIRSAALFDLDGTLIDTAGEISDAVNRTLADFGLAEVREQQVRDWIGHGTGWLMQQAWKSRASKDNAEEWARVMERFVHHYHETAGTRSHLFPYVAEVLAGLKGTNVAIGIVTNKESRFTDRVLSAHGLSHTFDIVISGDTLPTKKPDPAGVVKAIADLRSDLQHALFVGDSQIDVQTARNAGLAVWAVPYGYNHGEPISASAPDRLIDDLRPVLGHFQ